MEEVFMLLGRPIRYRLAKYLYERGPVTVSAIADHLDIPNSPTSQHLKRFRDLGMVDTEKMSTLVLYSVKPGTPLEKILELTATYEGTDYGQLHSTCDEEAAE